MGVLMEEKFFIARRAGFPYSGPTWTRASLRARWFDDEGEAKIAAETLERFSDAVFFVEKLSEGLRSVEYPFFERK